MKRLLKDRRGVAMLEYGMMSGALILTVTAGLAPGYGGFGAWLFGVEVMFTQTVNLLLNIVNGGAHP